MNSNPDGLQRPDSQAPSGGGTGSPGGETPGADSRAALDGAGQRPEKVDAPPDWADEGEGESAGVLLERMRAGDRNAAADFVQKFGPRIRRRVRSKLNPSMRRLFDSQEMLSTLARRLDLFVKEKRLQADNESRLWSLVLRISDNALIDKARLMRRLNTMEGPDGPMAKRFADRLRDAESSKQDGAIVELDEILQSLGDTRDRQILSMWLADQPHSLIAEELGMTAAAVRKRWQVIKARIKERLESRMKE